MRSPYCFRSARGNGDGTRAQARAEGAHAHHRPLLLPFGRGFSLATLPFGWSELSWQAFVLLTIAGFCGGVGQILLTESYRHADMSTIAPFEYTSIVLGIVIGYFLFGDVPTATMLAGTAIVVGAGIFIIYREHRLGLERKGARKHVTPQG